jgi:hypothetical protein
MDLPEGASFEFVEIRARSLAEHRAWLQILDDTMRRDALIPSQNRGAARTEMEISLTASQSYALLQSMAIQKASLFSTLLGHWCALTGELLEPGAGLQVTVSPLTPPIQPQPKVSEWIELHERGVISTEELRHQLALATANAISSPTLDDSPAPPLTPRHSSRGPGRPVAADIRGRIAAEPAEHADKLAGWGMAGVSSAPRLLNETLHRQRHGDRCAGRSRRGAAARQACPAAGQEPQCLHPRGH